MLPRHRSVTLLTALVVIACASGCTSCATNPAATVTPQAKIAHYGSEVLDAVTTVQKAVTQATDTKAIPVVIGQQITSVNEQIHDRAVTLGAALKTYDAAITLADRAKASSSVQESVAAISTLLSQGLGTIHVDNQTGAEIIKLFSNVVALVANISTEVAKGLSQ